MSQKRTYTDPAGVQWTVEYMPATGPGGIGNPDGSWMIHTEAQPHVLWFTSSRGERRELANFPSDWDTLPIGRLAELCQRAQLIQPGE